MPQGVLFKPDMHQAIREGRKTVTRRLDHLKEINLEPDIWELMPGHDKDSLVWLFRCDQWSEIYQIKPRYHVGEVVYIKEAWCEDFTGEHIHYKLDGGESPGAKVYFGKDKKWHDYKKPFWRSPLFLPEKFARDFVKIKDVRPERLQEIDNEPDGFKKEGYLPFIGGKSAIDGKPFELSMDFAWYESLWDTINPKYPFSSNPYVFRYEFQLVSNKG